MDLKKESNKWEPPDLKVLVCERQKPMSNHDQTGVPERSQARLPFDKLKADAIIIGFTGALGSGCSYFSEGLSRFHGYKLIKLSTYIRKEAKNRHKKESISNLQDIGNELRLKNGNDYLVKVALSEIDAALKERQSTGKVKVVIDGIRNLEEADILKQFPNFFLISVQAEKDTRCKRLIKDKRCKNGAEFIIIDGRDMEEGLSNGQQVKRCNDMSDIIILNDKFNNKSDIAAFRPYIFTKLYNKFIAQIEELAEGKRLRQFPDIDEALMTAAYVESRRSSCLKRKVGAVISAIPIDGKNINDGHILSSGFNDVPIGEPSCLEHPEYQGCARDFLIENLGKSIKHCPHCGEKIIIDGKCEECNYKIMEFKRRCPKCSRNLSIEYKCKNRRCKKDVFKEFLPGGNPNIGKMLDMCRALHAEENAILNLSMQGVPAPDKKMVLYTTTYPCNLCANKILKLGIKEVVYAEPYETKETKELLNKSNVIVRRFEGVKSTAYFRFFSMGEQKEGGERHEKGRKEKQDKRRKRKT